MSLYYGGVVHEYIVHEIGRFLLPGKGTTQIWYQCKASLLGYQNMPSRKFTGVAITR